MKHENPEVQAVIDQINAQIDLFMLNFGDTPKSEGNIRKEMVDKVIRPMYQMIAVCRTTQEPEPAEFMSAMTEVCAMFVVETLRCSTDVSTVEGVVKLGKTAQLIVNQIAEYVEFGVNDIVRGTPGAPPPAGTH